MHSTSRQNPGARPLARGLPLLGSSIGLLRDPLGYLRREHARLGDVFDVRAPRRAFTVLAGVRANRFIAVEGRDCFESGAFWGRVAEHRQCPHLMLAIDGADHKQLRGIYRDDVSRRLVDVHAADLADLLVTELERAASPDGRVPLRAFTRLAVSRLVQRMLTRGGAPIDEPTAHALMEVFRWDSNALLLGKWPRLALRAPSYRRHASRARTFLDALIRDTARELPDGWFGTTHRARAEHPTLFTDGDVRMSFLLPFVAGVDTVGSTLAFLLHELVRDPALLARVTAAVDAAGAAGAALDTASLRAIPELYGLVLETLRLYPTAFGVYRRTTRAFELAGAPVPAGRDVLVFTTSPHFDPRYFRDPDRFDIDRYAPPRNEHKQRYVFAPFGGGPHVCLGAGMGEALLLLAAATLVRRATLTASHPARFPRPHFDPSLTIDGRYTIDYRGPRHYP